MRLSLSSHRVVRPVYGTWLSVCATCLRYVSDLGRTDSAGYATFLRRSTDPCACCSAAPGHPGDAGSAGQAGPGHRQTQWGGGGAQVRLRGRLLQRHRVLVADHEAQALVALWRALLVTGSQGKLDWMLQQIGIMTRAKNILWLDWLFKNPLFNCQQLISIPDQYLSAYTFHAY